MQTNPRLHPRFIAGLAARYAPDLRRYVPKFWESAVAAARKLFLRFLAFRRVNPRRNPIPSYLRSQDMVSRHVADIGGGS